MLEYPNQEPIPSRADRLRLHLTRLRGLARKGAVFTAGVGAALLALLAYHLLFPAPLPLTTSQVATVAGQVLASATPAPAFSEQVYQAIQPSLVLIQTKGTGADGKPDSGLGSGVVIDDSGDILTAYHVVSGAASIQLTFADGTQSAGQVVSHQADTDIAVLKADQPPAQIFPATLGNPGAMRVGDEAYVVGNPFGLYSSMSAGVISGFNRSFSPGKDGKTIQGLIQVDASINPGNSGGPLLNRYGQVIGIVEGIVNPTGQDVFIGIGFAVPITTAGGALGSPPD